MLQRSIGWSNLILVIVVVCLFGGCQNLLPATGPTQAGAQAKLEQELSRWVAGDHKSKAYPLMSSIKMSGENPLSFKVRSGFPCKADNMSLTLGTQVTLAKSKIKLTEKDPAFKFNVDVDFESRNNGVTTKVVKYTVSWIPALNDWDINELTD